MSSFSFSNDYLKYLRSPEWDIIRKRRIQFDQGRCKNCGWWCSDCVDKEYIVYEENNLDNYL